MVDTRREPPLKLKDVAKHFRVSVKAVRDWANGVGGRRLETVKLGGTVFTSWEAISRFQIQRVGDESVPFSPLETARERNYQEAQRMIAAHA